MPGDIAISVRGLSKAYTITHNAERHVTLAEATLHRLRHPFQKQQKETFWALRDISFDIKKGDVVGIIGRNGAGKSTLLKIVSRITEPTQGEIDLYGRVGSLLEVGTGFHPELTGRENIYLNGHILGMRKGEIDKQFDAIVDFAGVEQFLDTPVKRYSSGMYVRLAFAVAAHLDCEIVVVDEVLAVGDTEFQKKCLGKMQDVSNSGRTVFFVSHNMAAVSNLCRTGIVLDGGRLSFIGSARDSIDYYVSRANARQQADSDGDMQTCRPSWARPTIRGARVIDADGNTVSCLRLGSDLGFELSFDVGDGAPLVNPVMGVVLNHPTFGAVGGVNMIMTATRMENGPHRTGTIRCLLRRPPLLQGEYRVDLWLNEGLTYVDLLSGYLTFSLEESDVYGTGRTPYKQMGVMYFEPEWRFGDGVQPRPVVALDGERVECA